ncbi:hypothetical protein BO70DRAFT_357300 [Aspergillus heteromorphus CBS 117.55]|uniref:Thymidylate kinase n=1 Tax=Aspergillus heteromorphus CBS 117.55 TaxID=1448321 RepID=A0A317X0I8_9EURO|nr:uncharacterized protein BO70DRAFT_357300 [Aspergillus heteromorphus CBS 117.55]PWY92154.1 hypothetical protein BO70DRAFT_357300 [Aspergillus heteromorphus CBS 117.55]
MELGAILARKRQPMADVDSENIDPTTLKHSIKRKRAADDEDDLEPSKEPSKPFKSSRVILTTVGSNTTHRMPTTPVKPTLSTPKSAPILKPAGRSPQTKSCKAFTRRSTIAKSRPESANRKTVHRPFSLASALSGSRAKSQATPKAPASWSFDIYVDTEQEEMTNLMQHSTGVLDISDQEGKVETSGRGKENIPPAELGIELPRSRQQESPAAAARKSDMLEESRKPLGDLCAADFYGDDCHAFSYAVIYDDEADEDAEKKTPLPSLPRSAPQTSRSKLSSVSSISALVEAATPSKPALEQEAGPAEAEIEIWESESATEEAADVSSA